MLKILYVRDSEEANNGPARNLRFPERVKKAKVSPFGTILTRTNDLDLGTPFSGWKYQPDYFEPPRAFHVGNNSEILEEPLCIYVPFIESVSRIYRKVSMTIKYVIILNAGQKISWPLTLLVVTVKRRYSYLLLFLVPGLFVSPAITLALFGATYGFLWLLRR